MDLKSTLSLIFLEIKLYFRDHTSTLFSFLVPMALIIVFGGAFGDDLDSRGYKGIDVVVATNIVFLLSNNGIMGITAIVAELKAKNTLKRYNSIGISNFFYLNVLVMVMLLLSILSFAIFYPIAIFFYDATIAFNISFTNLIIMSGVFCLLLYIFSLIGYIITLLLNSTKNAMLISSGFFLILVFSSGIAIPLESLPPNVQEIMQYTPMYAGLRFLINLWCDPNFSVFDYTKELITLLSVFVLLLGVFFSIIKLKRNDGQHRREVQPNG
jgi:ABC-2 type transport system permease protein